MANTRLGVSESEWPVRAPVSAPVGTGFYSQKDEERLRYGKAKHRETTLSSERAARVRHLVALEARETAAATLGALQGQGQQVQRVNRDLDAIDSDTKEAQSTLRDLECGRCCCCFFMLFSCCCDCDPHAERGATRKARVTQRKMLHAAEADSNTDPAAKGGLGSSADGALDAPTPQEMAEKQRQQLFDQPPSSSRGRGGVQGGPRGEGLQDRDRDTIRKETEMQNRNLDIVGDAAADMRRMAHAMHAEAQAQDPDITAAQDKIDPLHTNVRKTARQAFNYVHRL